MTAIAARSTLLALCAAFLGSAPWTSADAGAGSCQTPTRASYQDADVIVWTQDAPDLHVEFIACWKATGKTVTALDFDNDCISASGSCEDVYPKIRRVVKAGNWRALYVESQISAAIALTNARTGTTPRAAGYRPRDTPRAIVLRRDGLLAWISAYYSKSVDSRELRICDTACRTSGRQARRLATGHRLSQLRLKHGRVYWSDGKRTHSATAK